MNTLDTSKRFLDRLRGLTDEQVSDESSKERTQRLLDEADRHIKAEAEALFGDTERGKAHRKMLEKAVLDTAQKFVLGVMHTNVEAMNKNFQKEIEELTDKALTKIRQDAMQAIQDGLHKLRDEVREMDARDRAVFLQELEGLVDGSSHP